MTTGEENDEGAAAFERFRDLARKLAQVPRREVDAEEAKERERREGGRKD